MSVSTALDVPLVFEPFLRPQVWGGRRLATMLGKSLPDSGSYGESWEISPLAQALSRSTAGLTIADVWTRGLAERAGLPVEHGFPWLIKWLDIEDRLSVQVHPSDEQARQMLGEPCGKSEAWVVLHAEPNAKVYAGFQPGVTAADVRQAISRGSLVECLHSFTPHSGDCINIPAGTVHAAGHGLVIAEVQQPSDATFRLFDWNRLGTDGKPRALHIGQSVACLNWDRGPVSPMPVNESTTTLLTTPYFQFDRMPLPKPFEDATERLAAWMVLDGDATLKWSGGQRTLSRGDTVLIPPGVRTVQWEPAKNSPPAVLLQISLPASFGSH